MTNIIDLSKQPCPIQLFGFYRPFLEAFEILVARYLNKFGSILLLAEMIVRDNVGHESASHRSVGPKIAGRALYTSARTRNGRCIYSFRLHNQ